MRHRREDQLSASESRPAYLDEFERKLAAALAQQTHAKKTRFASARSSDVNLAVPSPPSLGEALTPSSTGGDAERPLNVGPLQPSSETREGRTPNHEAATVSAQDGGAQIAVGAATAPQAGGSGAVGASQPAGGLSHRTPFELTLKPSNMATQATEPVAPPADLAEASSADHASQTAWRPAELIGVRAEISETAGAEVAQAIADAFPQGGGYGPEKGIAAAEPVVSEAPKTFDVEALRAIDDEIAPAVEATNLPAHETGLAKAIKRGSRGWKFKASTLAVSVA